MLLRNTLYLTPCLALFLLACNDQAAHQQPQPEAAPSQVASQPAVAAAPTPQDSAKPSSMDDKGVHTPVHHHLAHVRHHAAPAMTESASATQAAAPAPAATLTVPTGTVLTVLLGQEVGSKTSNAGDAFTATVAEAVVVDGKPLIPAGSAVSGKVTEATPMGTFHKGVLHLTLSSINLNGQDQTIQTSTVSDVEKGSPETAAAPATEPAAGIAGAGASAAGMAGAGTSAAGMAGAAKVSALPGAGTSAALPGGGLKTEAEGKVGTVVAALTGNKDLVFPAQASVKFALEQALEIKP